MRAVLLALLLFPAAALATQAPAPVFTLPGGTYTMPTGTTVTSSVGGATITWGFVTSGSCTPNTAYSGSIFINPASQVVLCAFVNASGFTQSTTALATYHRAAGAVADPVFTLGGGTYTMPTSTTVTDATAGAAITWGFVSSGTCTPNTAYTGSIYINPGVQVVLCAFATKSGLTQSNTVTQTYVNNSGGSGPITPSPIAGSYSGTQSVTLSTTTPGGIIFYTLDGSAPDYTSSQYLGAISVAANTLIRAIVGTLGPCTGGYPDNTKCQMINQSGSGKGWEPSPYCQSFNGSTSTAWSASTSYGLGSGVGFGGNSFVSLQASNTNHTPPSTATSTAWWGISTCQLDDPAGGSGPAWPASESDPTNGGAGSTGTGYMSGANCNLSSTCLELSVTPYSGVQTDILWPNKQLHCSDSSGATCPTWIVSDKWVWLGQGSGYFDQTDNMTLENDSQIVVSNYNYQFGMQATGVTHSGTTVWDIGGYGGFGWTATGVTTTIPPNTWTHVIAEGHRIAQEASTKPCFLNGTPAPCNYWTKLIINGTVHNLQAVTACPSIPSNGNNGAGCTYGAYTSNFAQVVNDQFQIDSKPSASGHLDNVRLDSANVLAYNDPSAEQDFSYTIGGSPIIPAAPVSPTIP